MADSFILGRSFRLAPGNTSSRVRIHKTKSELAKFKMEMEHADKIRAEDAAIAHDREISEKYTGMLNAIAEFSEAPDANTKNAAISAINRLAAVGNAECAETLRAVKKEIDRTDAFEKPDKQKLDSLLDKITVGFCK